MKKYRKQTPFPAWKHKTPSQPFSKYRIHMKRFRKQTPFKWQKTYEEVEKTNASPSLKTKKPSPPFSRDRIHMKRFRKQTPFQVQKHMKKYRKQTLFPTWKHKTPSQPFLQNKHRKKRNGTLQKHNKLCQSITFYWSNQKNWNPLLWDLRISGNPTRELGQRGDE